MLPQRTAIRGSSVRSRRLDPALVGGATLISNLLAKFPVLVWAGAALLGWVAGELMVEDPVSAPFFEGIAAAYGLSHNALVMTMHVLCAGFVLAVGWYLMRRRSRGAVGVPGHEGGPAE